MRLVLLALVGAACRPPGVTVGAAISLKESLDEVFAGRVTVVYGASGDLASQMRHGAPFDVLASAGEETSLANVADRRCTLARNTLVLVRNPRSPPVTWSTLASQPSGFRLAVGLTPQVPAGVYAEEALRRLGVWSAISERTVRGTNVRHVLDLVARGEADAGVVYATDVRPDVVVVAEVPPAARPDIQYPVYVARTATRDARAAADVLCSDLTRDVLVHHGFLRP